MALGKLRKTSKLSPVLAARLAHGIERYTTQTTAWSLLALSDYIGARTPDGAVDVVVKLDGHKQGTFPSLGGDNKEVRIPLKELAGKHLTMTLEGDKKRASAFTLEAHYRRPFTASDTRLARRDADGVSIHRAFSTPEGKAIDLAHVKVGQVVRVAVRVTLPAMDGWRRTYVAITDRVPGGFDPINPDLATTGSVPDLLPEHPFYDGLHSGEPASHVELHEDKVQLYFDRTWGDTLYATYLVRATTPGRFALPPATGEMMYEPDSQGWSDAGKVTVE